MSESEVERVRRLLKQADHARSIERGADMARVQMRLRHNPVIEKRTRRFGWAKDRSKAPDPEQFEEMDPRMTSALYEALGKVMVEFRQAAETCEAQATNSEASA